MKYVSSAVAITIFLSFTQSKAQLILTDSSPKGNSVAAPRDEPIFLYFNDNVDPVSAASSILIDSDLSGTIEHTLSVTDNVVKIAPAVLFKPGDEITVTLLPSLKSLAGVPLTKTSLLQFIARSEPSKAIPPMFVSNTLAITGVSFLSSLSKSLSKSDLDGDGDIDIVACTSPVSPLSSDVYWLENDGNGQFTSHVLAQNIDAIIKILVFDFDRDGDMDILGASEESGILLFNNNGVNQFTVGTVGDTNGNLTLDLSVVDLDLNGTFDVVYSKPSEGTFVLFNGGVDLFDEVKISSSVGFQNICRDLDSDGDIDVLQQCQDSIKCLLNDQGQFKMQLILRLETQFNNLFVVDLNNDNSLDIVVPRAYGIDLLLNEGSLKFTSKNLVSNNEENYIFINVADFDGDGDQDVLFPEANKYFILKNEGALDFTKSNILGEENRFSATSNIVSADFDKDGDLDFVSSWNKELNLYENTTQSEAMPFMENTSVRLKLLDYGDLDWGDYDDDGDLDLLMMGKYNGVGSTILYRNENGLLMETPTAIAGYWSGSCDWGDMDLDGDLDILISGNIEQSAWNTAIYINNNGSFTLLPSSLEQLPRTLSGEARWADFNNDGLLDIVVAGDYLSGLYQSTGDANFVKKISLPDAQGARLDIGDADHDGDLDLVYSYPLKVFRNEGNWNFTVKALNRLSAGNPAWVDLDNDGDLDIVNSNGDLTIYYNQDFIFSEDFSKENLQRLRVSSPGDYNNDGSPDVIATSTNYDGSNAGLKLLKNDGSGNLRDSRLQLPMSAGIAAWSDYDSDHDLDIATESNLVQNITELKNTRPAPPTLSVDSMYNSSIYLHWTDGSDLETATAGLSYQLYMGTQSHKQNILTSNSIIQTGVRKLVDFGNFKGNSVQVQNLSGGDYFLAIQTIDASFEGSVFSDEAHVFFININGETGPCANALAKYTARPANSYTWEVTGGEIVAGQGTDVITVNWNRLGKGQVRIKDSQSHSNSMNVFVDEKPLPSIVGDTTVCTGLQEYVVEDARTYHTEWIVSEGDSVVVSQAHQSTVSWASSGTKHLIAQVSSQHGCLNYDTLGVHVDETPRIISSELLACTNRKIDYTAAAVNTTWSVSNGKTIFSSDQKITVQWPSSTGVGTISISGTSINGYCVASDSLHLTLHKSPPIPTISVILGDVSDTLISSMSPTGVYKWYYYNNVVFSGPYNGLITRVGGTFNVEVFNQEGCGAVSQPCRITNLKSTVTGVDPIQTIDHPSRDIEVYPVPANRKISVKLVDTTMGDVSLSIYSATGSAVRQFAFKKTSSVFREEMNIVDITPGIYVLTLRIGEKYYSKRFVKY